MNDTHGMVRRDGPATSEAAAAKVDKTTIRDAVIAFAIKAGAEGFIDHDLRAINPRWPESSARKRRSELVKDGILINTGATRLNDNNVASFVWKHRDFTADKQSVFIGSAASRPLTEEGLREAVALAHKRTASAALKVTRSQQEYADALEAQAEAESTLEGWLTRDQLVLF